MKNLVIIPGSFNGLHHGHLFIANYLKWQRFEHFDVKLWFEISKLNVDKSEITNEEFKSRQQQFTDLGYSSRGSNYKTFSAKMAFDYGGKEFAPFLKDEDKQFYFAVGADTAIRIVDTKYTYGSKDELNRQLMYIYSRGAKFLVFPRGGSGITLDSIDEVYRSIPGNFSGDWDKEWMWNNMFEWQNVETPNISSTQLRGEK